MLFPAIADVRLTVFERPNFFERAARLAFFSSSLAACSNPPNVSGKLTRNACRSTF